MDLVPEDDIFSFGLGLSWILREYRQNSSKKLYIFRCFNISVAALTLFFILANLVRIERHMYIKTTESVTTVVHMLLKYCFYIYYKPEILKIFMWKREFWNYRGCDRNVYRKCKKNYKIFDIIQKYSSLSGLSAAVMYSLRPLFNENNKFIFDCWCISDSVVLETIALFSQYYFLVIILPIVLGYDFIYFCCCAHLIVQLKILRYKLENMPTGAKINEIYDCVKHHQLLLLVFSTMKNTYFWMLLFHYIVTLLTCCSQLYVILVSSTDTADLVGTSFYIIAMLIEFAYYSFPAEQMVFELRSISVAIYASMWYERDASSRKTLLLVMMRSQQQEYLSAGGMIDMNVNAFGSVIRKAFSFYAILRNVLNK